MTVVYYNGERIYFRPIESEDEPMLRAWVNDPRVWATLGYRMPINAHREREWIESHGKDDRQVEFGIVVRDGDRLIGTCGLHGIHPIARSATFGLVIGETEMHGRGYGTEATRLCVKFGFEELNLNRIQLDVFSHNPAARRVYEKAGFVPEGCRRQALFRHGVYRDVHVYAILREEYEAIAATDAASNFRKVTVTI